MSNPDNPLRRYDPLVTQNLADLTTPGVVVEVDSDEAEALGAFEETALSEADAWESNADVGAPVASEAGQAVRDGP
jgi:hypothetical protein